MHVSFWLDVLMRLVAPLSHPHNWIQYCRRALHACQVWHNSSTKVLFVCNKEGHGRKVKEGNATAESDDSNYEEGGSELYKLTVGVLLFASVILALWQMGVERLSALSNQERSNLLSAGTKPGGCKFYSRREAAICGHNIAHNNSSAKMLCWWGLLD